MFRASVLSVILFTLCLTAAAQISRSSIQQGSIVGVVTTGQNQGAGNIRIEVRETMTGGLTSTTYTNDSGGFEIDNLGFGTYDVVATLGVSEAREQVRLQSPQASITLRMQAQQTSDAGNASTVSVSDFKVPKKAREAYHKAEQALQSFKTDEAMAHITKALEIYPRYAAAMTLRGVLKLDNKAPQEAMADLEQAIQYDPAFATAYLVLGATYNSLSRFDDSIRTIDRGIALSPTSWQGYFELGKAYVGKGDFTSAVKQLNKAEDMAPKDFALVHLVKAHAMLGMKDYSAAMLELQAYLTKHPQGPDSDSARKTLDDVRSFAARSDR
jgi:tetratricopeptide (TPR) repeat protein